MGNEHPLLNRMAGKLPTGLSEIIAALRGGGSTTYMEDGKPAARYFGSENTPVAKPKKGLRGYQLYNQEQIALGAEPLTYQEWLKTSE